MRSTGYYWNLNRGTLHVVLLSALLSVMQLSNLWGPGGSSYLAIEMAGCSALHAMAS